MSVIQGVTRYKASVDASPTAIANRRVMLHELKNGAMRYLGMKISDAFGNYSFGEPKSIYTREYYVTALDDFGIPWEADLAVIVGDRIRPSSSFAGYVYEVTTSGNLGSTEPTWPTVHGDSVNAGTAVLEAWEFAQPEAHGPFVAAPEPTAWLAIGGWVAKSGPYPADIVPRLFDQNDAYNTPWVNGVAGRSVTLDKDDIFTTWPGPPPSDVWRYAQGTGAPISTGATMEVLPYFEYFSLAQIFYIYSRASTWTNDQGLITIEFLNSDNAEVVTVECYKSGSFANSIRYKIGGVTQQTNLSLGAGGSVQGRLTFETGKIIFTSVQNVGTNSHTDDHFFSVDLTTVTKLKVSGRAVSNYTGGTGGGWAAGWLILLNPETLA